ncbi:MAG: DUF2083 domain-containing protein [Caulobacteraceae bacterium]|nr:DUF2083 domain-containing protein [Caulobacter sp.]
MTSPAGRSDKKLFLGGRLRRLRRELQLTQSAMAEGLGVSPSYFNLLERNGRPVTAQLLLRLAEAYDIDLRAFAAEESGGAGLEEALADPLFADLAISRHETAELAEQAPGVAEAVVRLYRAYLERGRLVDLGALDHDERTGAAPVASPTDWVRDVIGGQRNHFPELETLAEAISAELDADPQELAPALRAALQARHGVSVRVLPAEVLPGELRRYDPHRKRLLLSETLAPASRTFALAYQLGVLRHAAELGALAERMHAPDPQARRLLRVFLANYLAAAVMTPYAPFLEALEAAAYDLDRVRARFGASWEQAAQRLTTLGRPGARGIPFFMVRVDAAGNVSKRFAAGAFPFSRFGGACPRWHVHDCFKTPGRIVTQVVETPAGERWFTLSRTVRRVSGLQTGLEDELAIGLGCELEHAERLVYARGLDMRRPVVTAIGPACRICERPDCAQRAAPPVTRPLVVDEIAKSVSPYPFRA